MNTQEYEARFNPSEDDENMMALANDLASLMHNSNYLGRAMSSNLAVNFLTLCVSVAGLRFA